MGYLHIDNLYKPVAQRILAFKECYVMEKIHGTSAHISWSMEAPDRLVFFSGGEKYENFIKLFYHDTLLEKIKLLGVEEVTIFGEAYGGKQQKMSEVYGKDLRFVAFDVKIGHSWLDVPKAAKVVEDLGLEFVWYEYTTTDLEQLDAFRDMPSKQAARNGMGDDKWSEGIVIRPPFEVKQNNGARVMAKHKNAMFHERKTQPTVQAVQAGQLKMLEEARAIADEWVVHERLLHVLDKLPGVHDMTRTGDVITAMKEDVLREASGEIKVTRDVIKELSRATVVLYKAHLQQKLREDND